MEIKQHENISKLLFWHYAAAIIFKNSKKILSPLTVNYSNHPHCFDARLQGNMSYFSKLLRQVKRSAHLFFKSTKQSN